MKTTLVIDDHIMKRIKMEAARQGRTISDLVETSITAFQACQASAFAQA